MEFTSLSIIISFDDLYASSLVENKMHQAVGRKLRTKYRRSMDKEVYGNHQNEVSSDIDKELGSDRSSNFGALQLKNPRRNSFGLKLMRFIQKSIRIFNVSWNYYFCPFVTLFLTFKVNYDLHAIHGKKL